MHGLMMTGVLFVFLSYLAACTYEYQPGTRKYVTIDDNYELGQPRCCQSGWLAMPRSILRIWMCFFWQGVDHAPTNKWKACFLFLFVFLYERYDRYNDPNNPKATITCLKKKVDFPFVCTCGSYTRLKKTDRISHNRAGRRNTATCSRHYFNTCLTTYW